DPVFWYPRILHDGLGQVIKSTGDIPHTLHRRKKFYEVPRSECSCQCTFVHLPVDEVVALETDVLVFALKNFYAQSQFDFLPFRQEAVETVWVQNVELPGAVVDGEFQFVGGQGVPDHVYFLNEVDFNQLVISVFLDYPKVHFCDPSASVWFSPFPNDEEHLFVMIQPLYPDIQGAG